MNAHMRSKVYVVDLKLSIVAYIHYNTFKNILNIKIMP